MFSVQFNPSLQASPKTSLRNHFVSFGHANTKQMDTVEIQAKPKVYQFGTAGFREIGQKFTDALPAILNAMSDHLIEEFNKSGDTRPKPLLIGGDTRTLSKHAMWIATTHFLSKGFDVYFDSTVTPTPTLAYYAKNWHELGVERQFGSKKEKEPQVAGAILFTASHNPWEYGGINFLTPDGEVAPTSLTKKFESFQAKPLNLKIDREKLGLPRAQFFQIPEKPIYSDHLEKLIDFNKIKKAKIEIVYDSMYGAGVGLFNAILQHAGIRRLVNLRQNFEQPWKGFKEIPEGPDPTSKKLWELKNAVARLNHPDSLKVGLANDGDADRFGVIDENGNFVQPNDVIALTLYHLIKNKGREGVVVRSQATSHLLDEIAQKYRFPTVQTPVGYKYIAEVFKESEHSNNKVIIGGESSGGLSIYGHIPEKDGIIANLSILELMAYENKPIGQILKDLRKGLNTQYLFTELQIDTPKKDEITNFFNYLFNKGGQFAGLDVDVEKSQAEAKKLKDKFHTQDGVKLYFKDGSWLLARKSGTEPIARIYYEAVENSAMLAAQKATYSSSEAKEKALEQAAQEDYRKALEKSNKIDSILKEMLTKQLGIPNKDIKTKIGPNN